PHRWGEEGQAMADYSLTAGDIATFPTLLQIQGDIGLGITPLAQPGVWDFMLQLDVLAKQHYTSIHNAQLKEWVDAILTPLITTPTVYQCSVTMLYISAAWGRWPPTLNNYDPDAVFSFDNEFWIFITPAYPGSWPRPPAPLYWWNAVQNLYL